MFLYIWIMGNFFGITWWCWNQPKESLVFLIWGLVRVWAEADCYFLVLWRYSTGNFYTEVIDSTSLLETRILFQCTWKVIVYPFPEDLRIGGLFLGSPKWMTVVWQSRSVPSKCPFYLFSTFSASCRGKEHKKRWALTPTPSCCLQRICCLDWESRPAIGFSAIALASLSLCSLEVTCS